MLLPKSHLLVPVVIAFALMYWPRGGAATRRHGSSLLQNEARSGSDPTSKREESQDTFETSSVNGKWRYSQDKKLDPSTNETGSDDKENCSLIDVTNLTLRSEVQMIHASWVADDNNLCLSGFTATWRSLEGVVAKCTLEKDAKNTTNCSGIQLTECIHYEVLVQVITTNNVGNDVKKVASTAFTQPERPEAPESMSCSLLNSAVKVSWTLPISRNCPVNMYQITWSHANPRLKDSLYNSAITLETSYLLQTTISLTNYTVTVAAIMPGNVIGKNHSCRILTSDEAPSMTVTQGASRGDRSWSALLPKLGNGMKYVDNHHDPNMASEIMGISKGGYVNNSSDHSAEGGEGGEKCSDMVDVRVLYAFILAVLLLLMVVLVFSRRRDIQQKIPLIAIRTSKEQRAFYSSSYKTLNQKIQELVSRPGSLTLEFEALQEKSPQANCVMASLECNKMKNRFTNILPFDDHRVVLTDDMTNGNDYINASFILCPMDRRLVFVAAQTPKENTIGDFWRMIWNLSAGIIVTLAEAVEEHKIKSDQYWPLSVDCPLQVNQFMVELLNERKKKTHVVRSFRVIRENLEKEVKQLHFSDWTNFNVPNSHNELLEFLNVVREEVQPMMRVHLVVHCLAGVGRSGTFIGLWNLILKAEQMEQGDVEATILEMRKYRPELIQTKEQYFFLLECYAKYLNTPKFWNKGQKPSAAVPNAIYETQLQHPNDSPPHTTLQQNNSMPNHLGDRQPPNSQFNGEYPSGTNMSTSSDEGKSGNRQNQAEYPANSLQRQRIDLNSSSLKGKFGNPQNEVKNFVNNV